MSFPTTGVITSFTGADENPLSESGNWTAFGAGFFDTGNPLKRISNSVTAATTNSCASIYVGNPAFGPDCEAFVTMTTLPATGAYTALWLRATNTTNPNAYRVVYTRNPSASDTVSIQRCDAASITNLATFTRDFSAGDSLGVSILGTLITAYRKTGGVWSSVGTYDTSGDLTQYSAAGYLALNARDQTQRLDDFGGGNMAPIVSAAPAVSGLGAVGFDVSTTTGTWRNNPSSYTYQWQRDNNGGGSYSNIASATTATHTVVSSDLNCNLRCVVTATNSTGTASANSNAVGPAFNPPTPAAPGLRIDVNTPTADQFRQLVPGAVAFVGAQLTQSAAYYNGNTYVGYISGDGAIRVAKVNKATGAVTISPAIVTLPVIDQHSTPGVLVRSSDHKIVVCVADVGGGAGVGAHQYSAISSNAEDVSSWGAPVDLDGTFGKSPYTYTNMQQLSGESEKIYLFFSSGFPPTAQELWFSTSTNGGSTWAAPTKLWGVTSKTCYWAINSDDTSRIDFACTSGHVLNSQTSNVYHFYYDGSWRKTDGTSMGSPPFTTTDATKVYDGPTNGNVRVPYAISKQSSNTAIVWAAADVTNPTTANENYWYAVSASGGAWAVHTITDAGLPPDNNFAEGGIMVDPFDVNHVLLGKSYNLYSYRTSDGGATWSSDAQLTTDGSLHCPNLRPFAPHNADASLYFIFEYGPLPLENANALGAQIRGYSA